MHKQQATFLKVQYFAVTVDNDFCMFQKPYLRLELSPLGNLILEFLIMSAK